MILLLLACGEEEAPTLALAPAVDLLFHDVSVFVGDPSPLLRNQDVWVSGGRVKALGPSGSLGAPDAEVVEGAGRTLLPGYVDAHTHLLGNGDPPGEFSMPHPRANLEAWLRSGVTSVVDMGGVAARIAPFARAEGEALPRVRYTGAQVIAPGGHPTLAARELLPFPVNRLVLSSMEGCHDAAEAEAQVEAIVEAGADHVKIILDALPPGAPILSEACLRAAVDAAHAHGKRAFVHIGTEADALAATRAGADALAHGIYKGGLSVEAAAEIAAAGIPVIPTLSTFEGTRRMVAGEWSAGAEVQARVAPELWTPLVNTPFSSWPVLGPLGAAIDPRLAEGVLALYNAGVTLLVGSDASLPTAWPGLGFHAEIRALGEAGIPPLELLHAATRAGQIFAGDGAERGRVEPGFVADLVLVEGDPSEDLAAADEVVLVLREGRRVLPLSP